jgi:hypothetical protein
MKILLYCLGVVVILFAILFRYETHPLPQTTANPWVSFLRLDRWTGQVEVGREYSVASAKPGGRNTGFAWEPVRKSLAELRMLNSDDD